jgi:hypothetical protein
MHTSVLTDKDSFLRIGINVAALRNAFPQAFMMVTIDCGVLAGIFNPHAGSSHSSVGLTAEELLEFAYIAGAHPNVRKSALLLIHRRGPYIYCV